jgi:hypothetical protein
MSGLFRTPKVQAPTPAETPAPRDDTARAATEEMRRRVALRGRTSTSLTVMPPVTPTAAPRQTIMGG